VLALIAFGLTMILLTLAVLSRFDLFRVAQDVDKRKVTPLSKHGYRYPAPRSVAPLILVAPPEACVMVVKEDGAPVHCQIAAQSVTTLDNVGGGLCIFVGSDLFFSAHRPEDPRSNGRRYTIEFSIRAHPVLIGLLAVVAAFFGLMAVLPFRGPSIVMLAGALLAAIGAGLCAANIVGIFRPLRSPSCCHCLDGMAQGT
jgi:hypothetical protein